MEKAYFHFIDISTVVIFVVAIVSIMMYSMYVKLIKQKNSVAEALSDIDVQLKKRYDLIPNILTIANKFMEHERDLLDGITKLRTQAGNIPSDIGHIGEKIELDRKLSVMMERLSVQVENYPQLKSDQTMLTAMQTYNEVEEHIAAARRFFNSAVKELNNSVEIFPSSILAAIIGIKSVPFIKVEEQERQNVNAAQFFNK